jgi:glycosyltransferase involved in cell wall biosynthesis
VVAVGRLCRQKNPELFCRIAERCRNASRHLRFAWIGDGDANLLSPNSGVMQLGFREDAREIVQAADLCLMTSRYESFGYVTAEAMAAGVPVIGTNVTGTIDLIRDGVNGFLFDPADETAAVSRVIALAADDRARAQIGAHAAAWIAENYNIGRMVEKHEALYEELALVPGHASDALAEPSMSGGK